MCTASISHRYTFTKLDAAKLTFARQANTIEGDLYCNQNPQSAAVKYVARSKACKSDESLSYVFTNSLFVGKLS